MQRFATRSQNAYRTAGSSTCASARAGLMFVLVLALGCGEAGLEQSASQANLTLDPSAHADDGFTSAAVRGDRMALYRALADRIAEQLRVAGVPGGALSIVEHGKLRFATGLGVKRAGDSEAVHAETRFRVASTTKVFTAAAAAQLASVHRLSLDAPVTRYAPELRLQPPHRPDKITLRKLLSHTAGVPDYAEEGNCPTGDDALRNWFTAHPNLTLWSPPGRLYSYSNLGYAMAAHVLERATGVSYRELVEQLLVAPLRLTSTTFDTDEALASDHAAGHPSPGEVDTTTLRCGLREPHGLLWSSAVDLAKLAEAFLSWGGGVLDPRTLLQMAWPHVSTQAPPDVFYGLGLFHWRHRGVLLLGHPGDHSGYHSAWWLAPERGLAVTVLVNGDGYDPSGAALRIIDELLALPADEPRDWSTPASDWARYVGRYEEQVSPDAFPEPQLGGWSIELRDDQLMARSLDSGEVYTLVQLARDTWFIQVDGDWIDLTFWRDRSGRAEYIATRSGALRRVPE